MGDAVVIVASHGGGGWCWSCDTLREKEIVWSSFNFKIRQTPTTHDQLISKLISYYFNINYHHHTATMMVTSTKMSTSQDWTVGDNEGQQHQLGCTYHDAHPPLPTSPHLWWMMTVRVYFLFYLPFILFTNYVSNSITTMSTQPPLPCLHTATSPHLWRSTVMVLFKFS